MTIQEISDKIKAISLSHKFVKSYHVGNTWDMAASKSSDIYPNVWLELPILVNYEINHKKRFNFSIDVLALAKQDNVEDELNKISDCEMIADNLMYAFRNKIKEMGIATMTGLTVKNINADMAVGVRIDIEVITQRECDSLDNFDNNLQF
jgi:hypothetical protein